ncbi:sulfate/molybdate ABC transporter ATP-binding protein [Alkalinema pantanalense CENA528]|uniref:sulfate/molybdate ABC transporter ATP-binding protein n=1 Tax=Alkalinema pantanalense TaxID=1620705 RepID=UPI003D6F76F5
MGISIHNVSKSFGSFHAIDQVSLECQTGKLVALLGPSGSGKSTLLRIIAGLEQPDEGSVYLIGRDATYRPVQERQIGFVFQHYALFKHRTVRQNIAFALELRKVNKQRIANRVEELIDLVQLQGMGDRYPSQLSGGQRQRVALARALAVEPQVLLLDEPFGALDAKVRKDLRAWLRNLHHNVNVTTVFVTHDQEEAMEVADEIVVMNRGRVEQVGTPSEIYDKPATPFVMSFIGPVNILPVSSGLIAGGNRIQSSDRVFLRPHDVAIHHEPIEDAVPAIIHRIIHLGREIQVELSLASGEPMDVYLSRQDFDRLNLTPQQRVYIQPKQVKVFSEYDLVGAST